MRAAAITLSGLLLAGCSVAGAPVGPSGAPSPAPTNAPVISAADPNASVEANFALFTSIVRSRLEANPAASATEIAGALAAAGFPAETMQASAQRTSIDLDVSAIQFATQWAGSCFVAQYTPSGVLQSTDVLGLSDERCLLGPGLQILH